MSPNKEKIIFMGIYYNYYIIIYLRIIKIIDVDIRRKAKIHMVTKIPGWNDNKSFFETSRKPGNSVSKLLTISLWLGPCEPQATKTMERMNNSGFFISYCAET